MMASLAADCCCGFNPAMLRIWVGFSTLSVSLSFTTSGFTVGLGSSESFLIPKSFENKDAAAVDGVVDDTSELLVTLGGAGGGVSSSFSSGERGDIGQDGEYKSSANGKSK